MSTVITGSFSNITINKSNIAKVHKVLLTLIDKAEKWSEIDNMMQCHGESKNPTQNIDNAFLICGWVVCTNEKGAVVQMNYNGEKFAWEQDHEVMEAIAPFVKNGSTISLRTEYNETFVYSFDGKTVKFTEQ